MSSTAKVLGLEPTNRNEWGQERMLSLISEKESSMLGRDCLKAQKEEGSLGKWLLIVQVACNLIFLHTVLNEKPTNDFPKFHNINYSHWPQATYLALMDYLAWATGKKKSLLHLLEGSLTYYHCEVLATVWSSAHSFSVYTPWIHHNLTGNHLLSSFCVGQVKCQILEAQR